MVLISPDA